MENVLLSPSALPPSSPIRYVAKLADFGLAGRGVNGYFHSIVGKPYYCAPEVRSRASKSSLFQHFDSQFFSSDGIFSLSLSLSLYRSCEWVPQSNPLLPTLPPHLQPSRAPVMMVSSVIDGLWASSSLSCSLVSLLSRSRVLTGIGREGSGPSQQGGCVRWV